MLNAWTGLRFKKVRNDLGLSQTEMAVRLGLSPNGGQGHISRWEHGQAEIPARYHSVLQTLELNGHDTEGSKMTTDTTQATTISEKVLKDTDAFCKSIGFSDKDLAFVLGHGVRYGATIRKAFDEVTAPGTLICALAAFMRYMHGTYGNNSPARDQLKLEDIARELLSTDAPGMNISTTPEDRHDPNTVFTAAPIQSEPVTVEYAEVVGEPPMMTAQTTAPETAQTFARLPDDVPFDMGDQVYSAAANQIYQPPQQAQYQPPQQAQYQPPQQAQYQPPQQAQYQPPQQAQYQPPQQAQYQPPQQAQYQPPQQAQYQPPQQVADTVSYQDMAQAAQGGAGPFAHIINESSPPPVTAPQHGSVEVDPWFIGQGVRLWAVQNPGKAQEFLAWYRDRQDVKTWVNGPEVDMAKVDQYYQQSKVAYGGV